MKLHAFKTLPILVAVSAATYEMQMILSDSDFDILATTVPFVLPIPNSLKQAVGNVTVTINTNGTFGLRGIIDVYIDFLIFSRNLHYGSQVGDTAAGQHITRRTVLSAGPHIDSDGITVPIVLPIPGFKSPGVGNTTVAVGSNSSLCVATRIASPVKNGNRTINFSYFLGIQFVSQSNGRLGLSNTLQSCYQASDCAGSGHRCDCV
jgi:hypothetical protein